ncbi:elongator complex protein 5 isoform X4 [Strix uralensis]|uniref:elongator complex protein 5 isoform X4 n=1 Tax=Strix uralensis TaxID=36305 RepID=UPI003DA2E3D5
MAAPAAVRCRHREAPVWIWRRPRPYGAVIGRRRDAMLEALVAGGAGGLVLVRDSAACEGRSLLRAFATAAVQRAERVLVLLFDVPREQFEAGLSPAVKQRLLYRDGFTDPLGWSGPDPDLRAARPSRLLALLHGDLHPPGLLRALGALASTQLTLGGPPPDPGTPRVVSVLSRPRRGGVRQQDESFTLLPDGSLRSLGVPPPRAAGGGGGGETPPRGFGGSGPPTPPHLPPAAVSGRAGGTGGRAPPVPAQPPQEINPPPDTRDHRLRPGAPRGRGPRGSRRRPGRVTPPRVIVGPT